MDKNISVYIPGEGGGGVSGRGCGELQGVKSGHVLGRLACTCYAHNLSLPERALNI